MPESIVLRRNVLMWISIASPGVHVIPLAVPSNLAVAYVRSPHGKRDHAVHRLISVSAAHARSPMANGNYATERLIRWTPHTPVRLWQTATTRLSTEFAGRRTR